MLHVKSRIYHFIILLLSLIFSSYGYSTNKLLIKNGIILTMKPGDQPFVGYVLIDEKGKIKAVNPGLPPDAESAQTIYNAKHQIIIPGFISAHSHLSESPFRGLATDQFVYDFPNYDGWVGALYATEAGSKAEDYYWYTLQGGLDHLIHGITSVYNFTMNPNIDEEFAKWQWKAELDSGIRFIHSFESANHATLKEREANLNSFLTYIHDDLSHPRVLKVAYSGWLKDPSRFKMDAYLIRKHHLFSEIHYLESPVNVNLQQDTFKYVQSENMLNENVIYGHFIHTNNSILKSVAKANSGMVWNPLSNGRLASGIVDIPKYKKMGVKIGMGVDGSASADIPDPFENMRTGLYLIRAKYENAKILSPYDVLYFHTLGSAEVLGIQDKVGSLEPGKFGDVLVIDPALVERGPVRNPYAAIVLSCNAMNIAKVYIGGDLIVDTYRLQKQNMQRVSAEVNRRLASLT